MKKFMRSLVVPGLVAASTLSGASVAVSASPADVLFTPGADKLQLQLASYTHYTSSDDYEGPPIYGGVEVLKANNWFYGIGLFNNSYSQFSQYLYVGRRFDLYRVNDDMQLHLKLSGGALHGYHGKHEDSLPVRIGDIGPVIIPSLGMHFRRWTFDLVFLVDEALMFNLGFNIID
jgi:hypothetical protein